MRRIIANGSTRHWPLDSIGMRSGIPGPLGDLGIEIVRRDETTYNEASDVSAWLASQVTPGL